MLLRPLEPTDEAEYVRIHEVSAESFRPWFPVRDDASPIGSDFPHALNRSREGWASGTHARLVGILDDGHIAGFFNLSEIIRGVFQNAFAGWSVSADVTSRGYATEGVRGLLHVAFSPPPDGLGLHRVEAAIIPSNAPSLRVAQKAGFRHEGLAKRYLEIAGRWQDHERFAVTVEEYHPER
jgi:ribosomal-protein-alanine N-acetyltransferase